MMKVKANKVIFFIALALISMPILCDEDEISEDEAMEDMMVGGFNKSPDMSSYSKADIVKMLTSNTTVNNSNSQFSIESLKDNNVKLVDVYNQVVNGVNTIYVFKVGDRYRCVRVYRSIQGNRQVAINTIGIEHENG